MKNDAFLQAAQRSYAALRDVPLRILVWGPGKPSSQSDKRANKIYNKRLAIKKILQSTYRQAEVFFPEDKEIRKLVKDIRGEREKSIFLANISDLIISLDMSRGSDAEIDDFIPNLPRVRDKVYILLRKKFLGQSSYVNNAIFAEFPDHHIIGFTDYELSKCHIVSKICPELALAAALRKKILEN